MSALTEVDGAELGPSTDSSLKEKNKAKRAYIELH